MTGQRELALAGMYNVRDLGGLPTRSGDVTGHGGFVRSESPHLLDRAGWRALADHGVRTIADLRSSWEIGDAPYEPLVDEIVVRSAPLEEGLLEDPQFRALAESGDLSCALYFQGYLDGWPERVAATFRVFAEAGPGAVLFHCQRGRDRTGLVALLLLTLADVPTGVIVEDHLRTDALLVDHGVALGHVPLDGEAELYAARGTTAEATLWALLDGFDAEAYLRDAGLTSAELDRLRDRLRNT